MRSFVDAFTLKTARLALIIFATLGSSARAQFVPVGPDKVLTTEWKSARAVAVLPENTVWKLDVKAELPPQKMSTTPVALSPRPDDLAQGVIINRGGDRAVVGYKSKKAKGEVSRVALCDLTKSTVISRTDMPGFRVPIALDDDGAHVLMRRSEGALGKDIGNADRLQIWNLADKGGTKVLEFTPYHDYKGAGRDVRFAAFVDSTRLITVGGPALVMWDLKTGKALYKLPIQNQSTPALSPDRKFLAFTTKAQFGIMDVDAGKVLVMQPVPRPLQKADMAFSPDGTRIACFATDNIFIWNVADGSLYRDIPTVGWKGGLVLGWTSNKDLRVGGNLLDTELQLRYWEYKGFLRAATAGGLTWFLLPSKDGGALIPSTVPHPAARMALEKAASDPNILVLKSGTKVKIDVSGLADPKERASVLEALKAKLDKNGFKADPQGSITLVASTDVYPEPIDLRYRFVTNKGDKDGPIKVVSFKVHFARLKFVHQGATVWESSAHNLPGDITLEEGETTEQHLKKRERPKYEFYQTVELPRLLLRDKGTSTLGSSQVTVSGVR